MMIYWLRLFGLIFAVICIIAIIGALLPRSYDFVVKETISASPQRVYQQIETLPQWQSWSQWSIDNETVKSLEYSDDELSQTWTDDRGTGSLWITSREPAQRVEYTMEFANFPEMQSTIDLKDLGDGKTEVTWHSVGQLPSGPFYGYFSPFFATGMRSHYQYGLKKLADVCQRSQE